MATEIAQEHVDHWLEHGYVLVPGFLSADEVAAGLRDIEALLAEPVHAHGDGVADELHFPFLGSTLNAVAAHPRIVAFVEAALGTRDVMLTQSTFWPKHAGAANYDQKLHVDFLNNTLAYPRDEGEFRQIPMVIYYSDVTEDLGPFNVVSHRHTANEFLYPNQRTRDEHPGIYAHETPIVAPAGSLVVYGMRTFHRGSAFRAAEGHRYAQFLVYRAASCQWMGYATDYAGLGKTEGMRRFLEQATPRGRELVGFPGVGHAYWNEETIAGVGARYPGMDMTPYRAATTS
jgi:hypothetical protein